MLVFFSENLTYTINGSFQAQSVKSTNLSFDCKTRKFKIQIFSFRARIRFPIDLQVNLLWFCNNRKKIKFWKEVLNKKSYEMLEYLVPNLISIALCHLVKKGSNIKNIWKIANIWKTCSINSLSWLYIIISLCIKQNFKLKTI